MILYRIPGTIPQFFATIKEARRAARAQVRATGSACDIHRTTVRINRRFISRLANGDMTFSAIVAVIDRV